MAIANSVSIAPFTQLYQINDQDGSSWYSCTIASFKVRGLHIGTVEEARKRDTGPVGER